MAALDLGATGLNPRLAAVAIVSHYPELLAVDPTAQGLILGHVTNAAGFQDFVELLGGQGPPGPTSGWAILEPIILPDGQPARNQQGQVISRLRLSAATLAKLPPLLAAVLQAVQQDPKLEGVCWTIQPGIAPGPSTNGAPGHTWSLDTISPRYGVGFAELDFDTTGNAFQLLLKNVQPRHLGLYATFLQGGQAVAPSGWQSRLPSGVPPAFETATAKYLGLLAPTTPVAAIPFPTAKQCFGFALPSGADAAQASFGSLGNAAWQAVPGSLGAIVTAVLDQAVPAILVNASVGHTQDAWFADLVADSVNQAAVIAAGGFLLTDPTIVDTPSLLAALTFKVDALLLDTGLSTLHDAINQQLGPDTVENVAPYLNWIWATAGALVTSNTLPTATSQLLSSPATFALDLAPSMVLNLEVDLAPDPAHGEWPDAADHFTVAIVDADGFTQTQTAPVPIVPPDAPLSALFGGVRTGGTIAIQVIVYAANGWACASAAATLDASAPTPGQPLAITVTLAEQPLPITSATEYQHRRKLAYDPIAGFTWQASSPPQATASTLDPGCSSGQPALAGLVDITLQEPAGCLGYCWQACAQGLPDCGASDSTVADGYGFRNLGIVNPPAAAKALNCAFILQPYLAFERDGDPAAARAGHGRNFYLDSRPPGLHLRGVTLDATTPFDLAQTASWGSFVGLTPSGLVVHPAGYVAAVDRAADRLAVVALPPGPLPDVEAPAAALTAGQGSRAGLLSAPVALDVTPDGVILVLEQGNARVQAFDPFGNPVPYFPDGSPVFTLQPESDVTYLDLAVSAGGLLYVLSNVDGGEQPIDYRLDVYDRDGALLSRTTGVAAARIAVDSHGRVYALNFEGLVGASARIEPTVSQWVPSAPTG
jgi:hypothetical protein